VRPEGLGRLPDDYQRATTQAQWEAQVHRLARRVRGLRIPNERRGVVDLYDVSDDWIPIYDRSDVGGFTWRLAPAGISSRTAGLSAT
jgi:sarcosine oxidase, subunit beta